MKRKQPSVWVVEWRPGKTWQACVAHTNQQHAFKEMRDLRFNCPDDIFRVVPYGRVEPLMRAKAKR
jgi:hypothetical protein